MPLSEHVCMWPSHSKWLSRAMNLHQILCEAWTFPMETIRMIEKATAMGNWWLAASSQQHASSCIASQCNFLAKHQITHVSQLPYSPDLGPCSFWFFPKLESPLKGKRFQTTDEIQENMMEQLMAIGRLCEVPRCLLWRGLRHHGPISNVSCILYLLPCLYFS